MCATDGRYNKSIVIFLVGESSLFNLWFYIFMIIVSLISMDDLAGPCLFLFESLHSHIHQKLGKVRPSFDFDPT
ncbi:hypothetical protein CBR65_20045 [Cellvibrio sp. PSBB006]|nr:hypothetical protein CBR65_20045 [Cellvibrio sp. PSBB006]